MSKGRGVLSHCRGDAGQRGYFLFKENTPFGTPQRKARGEPLDPRHCRIGARRAARAAQQRGVGAEASYSNANAATPHAGTRFGKRRSSSSCSLAMGNAFLLDGHTARFLSRERKWGVWCCRPQAAFSSAPVWNYHRSSSSNFIIASSCSRICAFIGPSSRWS